MWATKKRGGAERPEGCGLQSASALCQTPAPVGSAAAVRQRLNRTRIRTVFAVNPVPILVLAGFLALLSGCTPAGPRALLEGRAALEAGDYPAAVEQFTLATSILTNNAQAWNYLGLACHRAGDATRAQEAYRRALVLDRDLFEAHFNLGCLWLEEGKPDAAKSEFIACTLRRGDSFDAWLNLGVAHSRLGEITSAENSFQKALRLSPNHPEVLNGLGLVSIQRRRPRDAAQYFAAALKQQADYRPALLNLATVLRRDLGDANGAAQRYREYLSLDPEAADALAIKAILQSLEPKPVAMAVAPVTAAITNSPATNLVKPTPVVQPTPTQAKSNPPAITVKPVPTTAVSNVAIVQASPPATQTSPPVAAITTPPTVELTTAPAVSPPPTEPAKVLPEKRSFLSRLNPFGGGAKSPPRNVEVASATKASKNSLPAKDAPAARNFPRYAYLSPVAPAAGNRAEADAALALGRQAAQSGNHTQAVQAYQQAAQADPAYFEAQYHLGLSQYTLRDYAASLASWEKTLAIRPDSTDARYNFALTLKSAGYALDAAAELEKSLAANPNDVRAHLVLGNLCAEQLRDNQRARVHYQRILELDTRHPQATAIRYWLVANPG